MSATYTEVTKYKLWSSWMVYHCRITCINIVGNPLLIMLRLLTSHHTWVNWQKIS